MSHTFETKVNETIANLDNDLFGYAAKAALMELQQSWSAALKDGARPAALITDIDLVISQLHRAQALLAD